MEDKYKMELSTSVSVDDLKKSALFIQKNFYAIPINEKQLTNEQNVDKYHQLLDLSDFLKSFSN